jgi:hypothetical protein
MTEKDIIAVIYKENRKTAKYIVPNVFYYGSWEADCLVIDKKLSVIEYEVKCDRKDWSAEFIDKKDKHESLSKKINCANKYCFICPEGLILKEEVPEYAGLYYVTASNTIRVIKRPPSLHYGKIELCSLVDKFYYRFDKCMSTEFNTRLTNKKKPSTGKNRLKRKV